jgi:GNAT superfamily N-acetyltransferase
MQALAKLVADHEILPLRTRYRQEMNCQIVHDSIHRRKGWSLCYALELGGATAGFGSVAIGGPWKGKPTVYEFYLLPEARGRAFDLFEALLIGSGARFFEVQSNDLLLAALVLTCAADIATEKVVFRDQLTTSHAAGGAVVRQVTPEAELLANIERRQGGGEWRLEVDGKEAGKGGILFHYNRPYGDVYMEVSEPFRRMGLGSYLTQELKRACYRLGAVPCARCSPSNIASRRTLQRAGFVPVAHILIGSILATEAGPRRTQARGQKRSQKR